MFLVLTSQEDIQRGIHDTFNVNYNAFTMCNNFSARETGAGGVAGDQHPGEGQAADQGWGQVSVARSCEIWTGESTS